MITAVMIYLLGVASTIGAWAVIYASIFVPRARARHRASMARARDEQSRLAACLAEKEQLMRTIEAHRPSADDVVRAVRDIRNG